MSLRERLRSPELWYRAAVIVLLVWILAEANEAKEQADEARSYAAQALDSANNCHR